MESQVFRRLTVPLFSEEVMMELRPECSEGFQIWGNGYGEYLIHSEEAWCVKIRRERPSEDLSGQGAEWQRQGLWAMARELEAGTHENLLILIWLPCGAWGSTVNRGSGETYEEAAVV